MDSQFCNRPLPPKENLLRVSCFQYWTQWLLSSEQVKAIKAGHSFTGKRVSGLGSDYQILLEIPLLLCYSN